MAGSTERELQQFMDLHFEVLTAAEEECEELRDAGGAITQAFSNQPSDRLFGELLLLCQRVVGVAEGKGGGSLEEVAMEARQRAEEQRCRPLETDGVHLCELKEMIQSSCIAHHTGREGKSRSQGEDDSPATEADEEEEVFVIDTSRHSAKPPDSRRRQLPSGAGIGRPRPGQHKFKTGLFPFLRAMVQEGGPRSAGARSRPAGANQGLVDRLAAMGFSRTGKARRCLIPCSSLLTLSQFHVVVRTGKSSCSAAPPKCFSFDTAYADAARTACEAALVETGNDCASAVQKLTAVKGERVR